jgi:hypothetical protein
LKRFVKIHKIKIILGVALLISVGVILAVVLSIKKYDFVLVLSEDPAALCLDGSPGAYYISKKGHP